MSGPTHKPGPITVVANAALVILLLLAGSEFILRGPGRFARAASFNDFISPYCQSRMWLSGEDPYSPQNLARFWPPESDRFVFLSSDLADGTLVLKHGIPTAYPLTAFLLILPVALLPWHIAHPLWLAITVLSFGVAAASLLSAGRLLPWTQRSILFVALALALAPFHTGLAAGSIVSVAVAASAAAVWAACRDHDALAGVLLAVAAGLKPQIGLPFIFYYLVRRRWRIPAIAAGLLATLAAAALIRLVVSGTPWLANYLYDNRILFAQGSLGDYTEASPIRFGLVNFQVAAYTVLHHRVAANLTALAVATAAGLVWLFLVWRKRPHDVLDLSTLAVISLLPVYHRFYDAALLIFPLAWCLTAMRGPLRNLARGALFVILAVFLVPGGSALEQFLLAGHFAAVSRSWWWNMLVMPHESWSVLALSVLLLAAMQVERRSADLAAPSPTLAAPASLS